MMTESKMKRGAQALLLLPIALVFGCAKSNGGGSSSSGGTGTTPTYPDSTGNWVVQATATSGTLPFTQLSGYINEQQTGSAHPTTGAFQVASTGCFAGVENIPMQGVIQGLRLHLVSFGLDQQVIDLTATKDTTSTSFTGGYAITGGCADGTAGTLTGTRYSALTGTYSGAGASTPQPVVTLKLTQFSTGTGNGQFLISGTAVVTGVACFTSGSLASANGMVTGGHVQMHFTATQGGTMDIAGDFDSGATKITVSTIDFTGSGCPSNLGPITLSKA
jgi:hypothetical protein